eukprot:PRCOL_00002567-RA
MAAKSVATSVAVRPARARARRLRPAAAAGRPSGKGARANPEEVQMRGPGKGDLKYAAPGGGYDGYCTFDNVREAINECEGLEGLALEACWRSAGCDVKAVTDHYRSVAKVESTGPHRA